MARYWPIRCVAVLASCLLMTISAYSCQCFHRYYLYSIFYSEQMDTQSSVNCDAKIRADEVQDNQTVSLISYPHYSGQHPSNHGEAHSLPGECRLIVNNQDIAATYTDRNDKRECDLEIIEACKALKSIGGPKWPVSKPIPSTYIDF